MYAHIIFSPFFALLFWWIKTIFDMDEKMLSLEQETKIKEKALKLKEERKLRKIYPMVVFGDTTNGEKETYVV